MAPEYVLSFAAVLLECDVGSVSARSVQGGDINNCYRVVSNEGTALFIKANSNERLLLSEYDSLLKITEYGVTNYPKVVAYKSVEQGGLLALKYLQLQPLVSTTAGSAAQALIEQHSVHNRQFGWHQDGFIGRSLQVNQWHDNWSDFFSICRLQPQLVEAKKNGLSKNLVRRIERLILDIQQYIDDDSIEPALLHGDLWSGNVAFNLGQNCPTFYDPAPYFGDPEADIAMTHLFGSLPEEFYLSYRSIHPETDGLQKRHAVYNLYHSLNHFNLFGSAYESLVNSYCAHLV